EEVQLIDVAVVLVHLLQHGPLQSPPVWIERPPMSAIHVDNAPAEYALRLAGRRRYRSKRLRHRRSLFHRPRHFDEIRREGERWFDTLVDQPLLLVRRCDAREFPQSKKSESKMEKT